MVDVGQLGDERSTFQAGGEVILDRGGLTLGESAAGVGAELVVDRGAGLGVRHDQVLLEVGLTKALAGAIGQRRNSVRGEPQDRCDLGRAELLHLHVPQHGTPPLGQRGVGLGHQRALEPLQRRIHEGNTRVVGGQIVRELDP